MLRHDVALGEQPVALGCVIGCQPCSASPARVVPVPVPVQLPI